MNASTELLTDAFRRIHEEVHRVLGPLSAAELAVRPEPGANSIGWLIWHLTRVQDDHVAELAGREQAWIAEGWWQRFALPFAPAATGYGHTSADVDAVAGVTTELLASYFDAVHERTLEFVASLGEPELARIVDTRWDPPVTLGVRLVSVIADDLQHVGQAAYVAGMLARR